MDRPENRVIVSALRKLVSRTISHESWRKGQEFLTLLRDVPESADTEEDFRLWRNDRIMTYYVQVKKWCEMIINDSMPLALVGETEGFSLLYPMEKLFECYVETGLRAQLTPSAELVAQCSEKYLCTQNGEGIFKLRPDFLLKHNAGVSCVSVLDAKWKLVDQNLSTANYQISEQDIYQMLSYASAYMNGRGDIALIYPAWDHFTAALKPFKFNENLHLWVIPFDLKLCRLHSFDCCANFKSSLN